MSSCVKQTTKSWELLDVIYGYDPTLVAMDTDQPLLVNLLFDGHDVVFVEREFVSVFCNVLVQSFNSPVCDRTCVCVCVCVCAHVRVCVCACSCVCDTIM